MLQATVEHSIDVVPGAIRPRLLIVEDERITRETLSRMACDFCCDVLTAKTPFEALRIAAEQRPDVIILDGLLPQMHGFELSRLLRNIDLDYTPRIILMTAIYKHIRYQNEARLKFGIDTYLIKPVSREQLQSVLS